MAQFKDMLVFGTARFMDDIHAKRVVANTFIGDVEGNASSAIKARQDALGQAIDATYIAGVQADGTTVTFTRGNGSTFTIATQDTHVDIIDNLTTSDPDSALSANMGRQLEDEVTVLRDAATVRYLDVEEDTMTEP